MNEWYAYRTEAILVKKPEFDISGRWKNAIGSVMEIKQDGDLLKGKYSTGKGKAPENKLFPLTGFINGDLIGFTVNFGEYGTITSWTGYIENKKAEMRIITNWIMITNRENRENALTNEVNSGTSHFIKSKE